MSWWMRGQVRLDNRTRGCSPRRLHPGIRRCLGSQPKTNGAAADDGVLAVCSHEWLRKMSMAALLRHHAGFAALIYGGLLLLLLDKLLGVALNREQRFIIMAALGRLCMWDALFTARPTS